MEAKDTFRKRYESKDTPWDLGKPDFNLIEVVTQKPIQNCKALDIGCGTGDNSIWLAQNGFQVTGTDVSEIAIEKAIEKASEAKVKCDFLVIDFLEDRLEESPFDFAFDRGCFHSFRDEKDRIRFAQNVARHLSDSGLWLSLSGSADEDREGPGPPQLSASDIVMAVESFFMLLSLEAGHFGSKRLDPPKAWRCLMQKRPSS
jgi:SAM-dependent methyltransferase